MDIEMAPFTWFVTQGRNDWLGWVVSVAKKGYPVMSS